MAAGGPPRRPRPPWKPLPGLTSVGITVTLAMPSFRNGGLGRAAGGRRSGAPRLAALACTALLSILPVAAEPADSQPFPAMAPRITRSVDAGGFAGRLLARMRSEEHTSELQSRPHLVCRLLLEKKKKKTNSVRY